MQENDIGPKLLKEREYKGFSIEKVSDDLKIQGRYIEAIEKGNFDSLPGEVYVKAFLKTYGDYLGLNGRELVEEYKNLKKPAAVITPDIFIHHPKIRDKRKRLPVKFEITPEIKIGALAVLVLILFLVMILALKSCVSSAGKSESNANLETSTMPPLLLEAEVVTDDCWFEITKDSEAPVKGMYPKGYTREWSANEAFYIKVGNKNNMKFTFNGKHVPIETYKDDNNVVTFVLKREENKKNGK
ncbi:MAG: RodZ domain-containing protein [Candidatus Firestonebacteria bacterium]